MQVSARVSGDSRATFAVALLRESRQWIRSVRKGRMLVPAWVLSDVRATLALARDEVFFVKQIGSLFLVLIPFLAVPAASNEGLRPG